MLRSEFMKKEVSTGNSKYKFHHTMSPDEQFNQLLEQDCFRCNLLEAVYD